MKKLDLRKVADEFTSISNEHQLFYNVETGEFDCYIDPIYTGLEDEWEKFEDDCWIRCPCQRDLQEYDIMVDFTDNVTDPHNREMLYVALEGRGAFRRFKDTLHRTGLINQWYDFKFMAFIDIAREWCEENELAYNEIKTEPQEESTNSKNDKSAKDIIILPLNDRMIDDAVEILSSTLNYSKSDANGQVKRMLSSKRISLVAIAKNPENDDLHVVGIVGAIPQYGITGWELHPLAVLKDYKRQGIGRLLVETLEREVAMRGGIMIYLGSDDETGTTSLYGEDLYNDTFEKLANIRDVGGHPFPFYKKLGYKIVGVFPDANGYGKPDIWMAKRIR